MLRRTCRYEIGVWGLKFYLPMDTKDWAAFDSDEFQESFCWVAGFITKFLSFCSFCFGLYTLL